MDIMAASGHASDIQEAWDQTVTGDNIVLPEGIFNLYARARDGRYIWCADAADQLIYQIGIL